MRRSLAHSLLVLAGVLSAGCAIDVNGSGAEVREEKTFSVAGEADLALRTFDGAIEVRSWDRGDISVEIVRRAATAEEAKALEVRTTQDGNRILVEAPDDGDRRRVIHIGTWVSERVSLIVRVPRTVTLDARTGDGSITVADLDGRLTLRTGDGAIRGERLDAAVLAHTGDGSIGITDARGRFDLDTGDGSIRVSARVENLSARTGDGSVSIDAADGSTMTGDWSVTTGDGSVTMSVPSGFNAEVEAASVDGRVVANWADGPVADEADSRRYRGRLGTGGHTLRIRSGDGSITLTRR